MSPSSPKPLWGEFEYNPNDALWFMVNGLEAQWQAFKAEKERELKTIWFLKEVRTFIDLLSVSPQHLKVDDI